MAKKKPNGYWNYDNCFTAAKNCVSRNDMKTRYQAAYNSAIKNGWIDDYTWFKEKQKQNYWNYDTCYQAALDCKTRSEFAKKYSTAYSMVLKNGWIDDYTWFLSISETNRIAKTKWTKETCFEEAKKYTKLVDYERKSSGAYHIALKNGWIADYTWFEKNIDPYTNGRDSVYGYFFTELNAVYIGRTINPTQRNEAHHKKGSVYNFSIQNKCEIPPMTILKSNINVEDGLLYEDMYVKKYKNDGWLVLNIAKTGKQSGSLGGCSKKWTKSKVFELAKTCKTRTELYLKSKSAYDVARKNGWLYELFGERVTPKGKKLSKERIDALKKRLKGHSVSDETRRKLSKALKGHNVSDETRRRLSESNKGRIAWNKGIEMPIEQKEKLRDKLINNESLSKQVAQFSSNGKFIKKFPSISEASRQLNICTSHITECCNGKRKKAKGFIWKFYENDNDLIDLSQYKDKRNIKNGKTSKAVNQYDDNGGLIKTYPSISEASRQIGCSISNILLVLKGRNIKAKGFRFRYADECGDKIEPYAE